MGIGNLISKGFLTLLLAVSVFALITLYTSLQFVTEENIDSVIATAGTEVIAKQVFSDSENQEVDEAALYQKYSKECENKESIIVDGPDIVLDCDEIRAAGPSGIGEILKRELEKKIRQEVTNEVSPSDLSYPFKIARALTIGVLIFSIIIVFVLFITSSPKNEFFISLGIAGFLAGLPGFFIKNIDPSQFQQLEFFSSAVSDFAAKLAGNLLIVLFAGMALTALGVVFKLAYKPGPEEKEKEAKLEKKKKAT